MALAPTWTGPGEDLRGLESGWLTVEAAAPADGVHLCALCRCRCGRVAVRRIAALAAGEERACRRCADAEREERAAQAAEPLPVARARARVSPEQAAHEAERERINAAERSGYDARRDTRNARRRARYVPHVREPQPCRVPGCTAPIGRGRHRYCDGHGEMAAAERAALMGRTRRRPRAGDPDWAERLVSRREYRRRRRAADPAFRALEARLAREYRARKREEVKAA